MNFSTPVIVNGNSKGGVGKTFTSMVEHAALRSQGLRRPVLVHIESEDRLGPFFIGDAHYHHLEVGRDDLQAIEAEPSRVYDVFDRLMEILAKARAEERWAIVDLPANLDHALASYAREQGEDGPLGLGTGVLSIAVTHGRTEAMTAAGMSVQLTKASLPDAVCAVLFNNIDASAKRLPDDPVFMQFAAKARAAGAAEVLHLPQILAPALLKAGDDLKISFGDLLTSTPAEWQARGLNPFRLSRERSRAFEYMSAVRDFLARHTTTLERGA